jgi:hypothetical protein
MDQVSRDAPLSAFGGWSSVLAPAAGSLGAGARTTHTAYHPWVQCSLGQVRSSVASTPRCSRCRYRHCRARLPVGLCSHIDILPGVVGLRRANCAIAALAICRLDAASVRPDRYIQGPSQSCPARCRLRERHDDKAPKRASGPNPSRGKIARAPPSSAHRSGPLVPQGRWRGSPGFFRPLPEGPTA